MAYALKLPPGSQHSKVWTEDRNPLGRFPAQYGVGSRVHLDAAKAAGVDMSSLLKKNVGSIDRVLRIALGVGLLSMAFTGPQSAWGYLGFIPLLT